MEPITTTIVASLVAGAAAASKEVATTAIKDAYSWLKKLISERFAKAEPLVELVEADPTSEPEQQVLAKTLDAAGAGSDQDMKTAAEQLLDAIETLRGMPAADALFDFDRLRVARNLELDTIKSLGTVFRGRDVEVGGDFTAKNIRQSGSPGDSGKKV
jgi:hypothetical protein